ncbi:hypothetical protein R3P38DRAFT_3373023 [Favolaschia claudopus]|uniref:Uncharacterized protein n=1 Tax=Favolaschia claudopus TaxID=2862362 RepID=A0AAV9ZTZ4_9AGAR
MSSQYNNNSHTHLSAHTLRTTDFSSYGSFFDAADSTPPASSQYNSASVPWSQFNFDQTLPRDVQFPPPTLANDEDPPYSPFANFNWDPKQFRDANANFKATYKNSSTALANIHDREPELARIQLLSNSAINLPRGPIPSLHAATTPGSKKTMEEEQAGSQTDNDDDDVDENGAQRANFSTGKALIKLASAAAIAVKLSKEKEFRNAKLTDVNVQRKVRALVKFKKDPSANTQLGNIIGKETADGISIAALLEPLEHQFDQAKGKSDKAKAETKKKNDEDREGGEAIRQHAMRSFRKRLRSPSPTSDDTDVEVVGGGGRLTTSRTPAATSSVEIIDSDSDNKTRVSKPKTKACKRRRLNDPSVLNAESLALMKESERRTAHYETEMMGTLKQFVADSTRQKDELLSVMRALVEKQ